MDEELITERFFGPMEKQHGVVMTGREHLCESVAFSLFLFLPFSLRLSILSWRVNGKGAKLRLQTVLEIIATDPAYQKRGLAGKMLIWGKEYADKLGVDCYLDAGRKVSRLYEKFGVSSFSSLSCFVVE